jgi:hypothetical protein
MPEKRSNEVINFYAATDAGGRTAVFTSKIPISSATAIDQINKQRKQSAKGGQFAVVGKPVLRIALDLASRRIYNPEKTTPDPALLQHITYLIESSYGGVAKAPLISSDPLTGLRILRASNFPNAWNFIQKLTNGKGADLPVVQADLSNMPNTARTLQMDEKHQGRYVGREEIPQLAFASKQNGMVHSQSTPFIIINTSESAMMTSAHKERIVLTGYREGMSREMGEVMIGGMTGSQFFAIEFLIYAGWSMSQICALYLNNVRTARELISMAEHIAVAAKHMAAGGYVDITEPPYYYCFIANSRYQGAFFNGPVIQQIRNENGWALLKSHVRLNANLLKGLGAELPSVIESRYQPGNQAFVLSSEPTKMSNEAPGLLSTLQSFAAQDSANAATGVRDYKFSFMVGNPNTLEFERRRVTDFPQVTDILRKACQKLSLAEKRPIKFFDMEVVTGPWQQITGLAGGYMDRDRVLKNGGKLPWVPFPGMVLNPPFILVDNQDAPTPADQANVIIHEYYHYIFYQELHGEDVQYEAPGEYNTPENLERWRVYLTAPTERLSHIQQAKYMLCLGMSTAEIVRYFFADHDPGFSDLPRARQYAEYVEEAAKQLEQEKNDERPNIETPSPGAGVRDPQADRDLRVERTGQPGLP